MLGLFGINRLELTRHLQCINLMWQYKFTDSFASPSALLVHLTTWLCSWTTTYIVT